MQASELRAALQVIGKVLREGKTTHVIGDASHWLSLSSRQHALRALRHLDRYLATGNVTDLSHACTRLVLGLERQQHESAGSRSVQDLEQLFEARRAR
jgi:DNA-binding NtrC family response regulator